MQNLVLKYSRINAYHIKAASEYNWKDWKGEHVNRFSKEYEEMVDELYISVIQNLLYRNVLKKCDKYILHEIGNMEKNCIYKIRIKKGVKLFKKFLKY